MINSKSKIKNQKLSSGFTLLELVVVIVIIGVLAGVSAPKIVSALNAGKLRGEANKILTTMRYAQGNAAIQRATYRIKFNLGNSEFDEEKEFANQSYELIRDASKNDFFEFSDDDLMSSGGSSLFPGQQNRGLPSKDTFDYKDDKDQDQDYYEENKANSNRNTAGTVEIFDEKNHKLPSGVKIIKIVDGRDNVEITEGEYVIPIDPKGQSLESYIYLTSSGKNPPTYIIHIGMNGLSEAYLKDEY